MKKLLSVNKANFSFFVPNFHSFNLFKNYPLKYVSSNLKSRKEREDRELNKIQKFWDNVDENFLRLKSIERQVEDKYKNNSYFIGKNQEILNNFEKTKDELTKRYHKAKQANLYKKKDIENDVIEDEELEIEDLIEQEIQKDTQMKNNAKDIYYIQLSLEDEVLLIENFNPSLFEYIRKGGKLILYNEIKEYNKKSLNKIKLPVNDKGDEFQPLDNVDIKYIKDNYKDIYNNENYLMFTLNKGKSFLNSLNKITEEKKQNYELMKNRVNHIISYIEGSEAIPFDYNIKESFTKYPDAPFINSYLKKINFDENKCLEHLTEIYYTYYTYILELQKCLSEKTAINESVYDQIESRLKLRTLGFVSSLLNNNSSISFFKDETFDKEQSFIFDKVFIKGVHLNREANDESSNYILINDFEDQGIRYFMHKYFNGDVTYFSVNNLLEQYADNTNDNKFANSYKSLMNERNRKIILRVYVQITHPFILNINNTTENEEKSENISSELNKEKKAEIKEENYKENDSDKNISNEINEKSEEDTQIYYNHLAVFENELISPSHTILIDNNFDEWLSKHKLNEKNWKLVDIDNFMKGNSFFNDKTLFQKKIDEFFTNRNILKIIENDFPEIKSFNINKTDKKETNKDKRTNTNEKINDFKYDYHVTKIKSGVNKIDEEEEKIFEQLEKDNEKHEPIISNFLDILVNFFLFLEKR